jgi:hypothetical protein
MVENGQNDREALLFFDPSSYTCIGTNFIRIGHAPNTAKKRRSTNNCTSNGKTEDDGMKFGLLALFKTKDEEDDVEFNATIATDDVPACCLVVVIEMSGCPFRERFEPVT